MSVLALIPARGGSKRIPGKNIAPCAGRPLLAYTIEAALGAMSLDRIVLSTDSEDIADVARANGLEVPSLRPAHLAGDDTLMIDVAQHHLDEAAAAGEEVEVLVLLQPTSPLRLSGHIDDAVRLFRETGPDSVVSVVDTAHIYHPLKALKLVDGYLQPYIDGQPSVAGHRDLPTAYARNGPAVVVTHPDIIRDGSFYGACSVPYVMTMETSIDIDEPLDLAFAEFLIERQRRASEH